MTRYPNSTVILAAIVTILPLAGCEEEDSRLARMAEKHAERQARQSESILELQRELAEGSRRLVEADARSRQEMVAMQREVGRQRDRLESDRRAIAARRRMDPIIAAAITNLGLIVACLLPLVLCWYLLRRGPDEDIEADVNEILIRELVAETPLLLPPRTPRRSLPDRGQSEPESEPGSSTSEDDQHAQV